MCGGVNFSLSYMQLQNGVFLQILRKISGDLPNNKVIF